MAKAPIRREYPERPVASAHAVVLRDDRVLLVLRANEPSKGLWSLPGGMIELGETIAETVHREVAEECAVTIEVGPPMRVEDNIIEDDLGSVRFHYVVIYVLARYLAGGGRAASDAEALQWATRERLTELDMHPVARSVAQRALDTSRR